MPGLIENEAGALALLRHRAVEEIEHKRGRCDVDYRGKHALVDGDIVLLFGIVLGSGLGFGKIQCVAMSTAQDRHMVQGQIERCRESGQ